MSISQKQGIFTHSQVAVAQPLWKVWIIAEKQKRLFQVVIQTSNQISIRQYDFNYLSIQM